MIWTRMRERRACSLDFLNSQLLEKLFTESSIVSRGEPQHFATYVRREIDGKTAASTRLLLTDFLLEFLVALAVSDFGGVPRFAKQESTLVGIDLPERIGDTRE